MKHADIGYVFSRSKDTSVRKLEIILRKKKTEFERKLTSNLAYYKQLSKQQFNYTSVIAIK